ncbi:alpha beta-hydrolase [Coniophora puteana RWD-64-598 SS2]|uniref:acylaminoacyl-peptidase n=1 Tax=Coniophora puteana (strain RWD-64-598) TaxID=741705 RepID=A0A5M3MQT4_CONPW|nr:alpha beta-hydrolase [Coniophora puteana RWD-64-598 SS2]EIW81417.1 alpha beta-hydrolase [Coniophora puteana RWD-64-598 SS2]
MSLLQEKRSSPFFDEITELPAPSGAAFRGTDGNVLRVKFSFNDRERKIKRSSVTTFFVAEDGSSASTSSFDASDVLASAVSPSGAHQVHLRSVADPDNGSKKRRVVEVWKDSRIIASMDVTDKHGDFHTDAFLSSLSFSPSETALIYCAEPNGDKDTEKTDPYQKWRFVPHGGEGMSKKKRSAIYLFRWSQPTASSTPPFSKRSGDDMSLSLLKPSDIQGLSLPDLFGQAIFASEDRIFAVGYKQTKDGRMLGLRGCFSRPVGIYALGISSSLGTYIVSAISMISDPTKSCRSPKILRNAEGTPVRLFWLSNTTGKAHNGCTTLHSIALTRDSEILGTSRVLVDSVWDPEPDAFPGLYVNMLPEHPFVSARDSTFIVASSTWRSRNVVLLIDASSGAVRNVTPSADETGGHYTWDLLCTDGKRRLVCSRHSPARPWEVLVGTLDDAGEVRWNVIHKTMVSTALEAALSELEVSVVPVPGRPSVETIVTRRRGVSEARSKPYCVSIMHGGPHSSSSSSFWHYTTGFALEGYVTSTPNFTGSVGYGQKFIEDLLGNCGSRDVEDCMASVRRLVDLGIADANGQFVAGASHGGFISAHLIGQHPTAFKAAALRNPVISLGDLSSDMPDWFFQENGFSYGPEALMRPEMYTKVFAMSPIAYVDDVRAPVLIMLGEEDKRMPPLVHGKEYYHALKGRGKVVEMLMFPGQGHTLDGVEATRVGWEATRDWFASVAQED